MTDAEKVELPQARFYLFGMGNRRKLLYREGKLLDLMSRKVLREWPVISDDIRASDYAVTLKLQNGKRVTLHENDRGVWIDEEATGVTCLATGAVNLPRFEGHPHQAMLRALHQEILINIVDGKPVPNLLCYPRPWYRDAAMMCMCLEKTGNLDLVRKWILELREPFDRNARGSREPDNLGQALYMISLVSDRSHPLVDTILKAADGFAREDHLAGITDGAEYPVFQTKWMKFGLDKLGLSDPYRIPKVYDLYSALFWMAYVDQHVPGAGFSQRSKQRYPYLGWAEDHFHRRPPTSPAGDGPYPLTWEAGADQADFPRMSIVLDRYVERRICAPHAWHAAEMFLYYLDRET